MALMQDGFFDEGSDRGEAPDDWVKTPGKEVLYVKAQGDPDRKKIKTRTVGAQKVDIKLDPSSTGRVGFENNMARYNLLRQSHGKKQYDLENTYLETHGKADPNIPDGIARIYAPKKYQPANVSYGASGPSMTYPDLAYHHNVSFLQLRRAWNFCMAYAKKTSDRKPVVDLMVGLLNLQPGRSKALVENMLFTPGAVSAEDRTLVFDRLTWMGWNLVEGPPSNHRKDDPGESFDDFKTDTYLNPIHAGRMQAIQTLNGAIENMTRQVQSDGLISGKLTVDSAASKLGGEKYQATVNSLRSAFQGIKQFNDEPLIPFDPGMWEYVISGEDARFQLRKKEKESA